MSRTTRSRLAAPPEGPGAGRSVPRGFAVKIAAATVGVLVAVLAMRVWPGGSGRLVVYCAHDSVYSEKVLSGFEERFGIRLAVKYDTEATKSLGLVQQIIREEADPRSEVFWNNEVLGTMVLAGRGLLHPYKGSGFARIPESFKDADGLWAGFAARMRVWIVNTDKVAVTEEGVADALTGNMDRVAMAKPIYGTTLTHYSVLWDLWGGEKLKAWHRDWRKRGVREVAGNATVKNLVAEGVCDLGLTDTDDFFLAKDAGKPVAMLPFRLGPTEGTGGAGARVICIPNTVAIVKGARHLDAAGKLVDYLLSEEVELALARSRSRQVPLGPVAGDGLPAEVAELAKLVGRGYPLTRLAPARAACPEWLRTER